MQPDQEDHAYFQAVEEIFVRLRGAPLLLSPKDWHVARRWHREGIPLDLVARVLEEVFAKRKERGTRGKMSSLRYCAPAVEVQFAHVFARKAGRPRKPEDQPAIDRLLIGGIIPGLMLSVLFLSYIMIRAKLNPALAPMGPEVEGPEGLARWLPFLVHVVPLLFIFAIVVGAMTRGWATPTESAALGVLGVMVVAAAYQAARKKP